MLEVICGPMFCGKTEELIRQMMRYRRAGRKTLTMKHGADDRYVGDAIVSHSEQQVPCYAAEDVAAMRARFDEAYAVLGDELALVAIDEFQFFGEGAIEFLEHARTKTRVVIAGLDMDSTGKGFGPMPEALARADRITKLTAVCVRCGADATRSHRVAGGTAQIEVGAAESYIPLCLRCFREGD